MQASPENDWDPTQTENLKASATKGVPLVAIGGVVLISFILFAIIRFCCCLCRKVRKHVYLLNVPNRVTYNECPCLQSKRCLVMHACD